MTPAKPGVLFTPASQVVTLSEASAIASFTAVARNLDNFGSSYAFSAGRGNDGRTERSRDRTSDGGRFGKLQLRGSGKRDVYGDSGESGSHLYPSQQVVTLSGASAIASFTAVAQTWTISGAVTP